jgi:hypothetical protein
MQTPTTTIRASRRALEHLLQQPGHADALEDQRRLQRGDHGQPDRAATDHQRHLTAPDVGLGDRVDTDRERLGQRRVPGCQSVRHLQQQGLAEQHPFGIAADIVIGIADAGRSRRRHQRRHRADPHARLQPALRVRAVIQHFTAELVAENHVARQVHRFPAYIFGHLHHAVCMLAGMQV